MLSPSDILRITPCYVKVCQTMELHSPGAFLTSAGLWTQCRLLPALILKNIAALLPLYTVCHMLDSSYFSGNPPLQSGT